MQQKTPTSSGAGVFEGIQRSEKERCRRRQEAMPDPMIVSQGVRAENYEGVSVAAWSASPTVEPIIASSAAATA